MSAHVQNVKFNNGYQVPIIGLGTLQLPKDKVGEIIKFALDVGYRHFDCALLYGNEKEIGEAIKEKIGSGDVKRQDLFVTSKLWGTYRSRERVLHGCRKTLDDLKLDYLDLYLIHFPVPFLQTDETLIPRDEDGKVVLSDIDYLETWRAMEDLVKTGIVRSIGVSNFSLDQVKRIIDHCEIKPVNNQIELHPYLSQDDFVKQLQELGVTVTSYFSLMSKGSRIPADSSAPRLFDDPVLLKSAKKHGKSVAQVVMRYHIDRNIIVIPRSGNEDHLKENFAVFDFALDVDEINQIKALDQDHRLLTVVEFGKDHKYYPF